MNLHCDRCGKNLGDYLFGKGGVEERAIIGELRQVGLPDITCYECIENHTPRPSVGERKEMKTTNFLPLNF